MRLGASPANREYKEKVRAKKKLVAVVRSTWLIIKSREENKIKEKEFTNFRAS